MKLMLRKLNQSLIKSENSFQIVTKGFLLLTSLFLFSCSISPINQSLSPRGEWKARALVKDKKLSKTYLINIDFKAQKPQFIRTDIVTPLGVHVASVAKNEKEMTYILPQKKIYYRGSSSSQALTKALGLALDFNLISNVLFDTPIQQKGWTCQKDKAGVVENCRQGKIMEIVWSERKSRQKLVTITHAQFELELQIHSYKEDLRVGPETFFIPKPKGFESL